MGERERSEIKDKILKSLLNKSQYTNELASELNVKHHIVSAFIEEMATLNQVILVSPEGVIEDDSQVSLAILDDKGRYFLAIDGGYTAQYMQQYREKIWSITKIVAGTLNALAIIVIGIFSLPYFENDETEKEVEQLQKRIEALERRAEASNAPQTQIAPVNAEAEKPETQPTR